MGRRWLVRGLIVAVAIGGALAGHRASVSAAGPVAFASMVSSTTCATFAGYCFAAGTLAIPLGQTG